jgi:hypothetical protein
MIRRLVRLLLKTYNVFCGNSDPTNVGTDTARPRPPLRGRPVHRGEAADYYSINRKNSAAFAVSTRSTSAVIAWANVSFYVGKNPNMIGSIARR